VIPQPLPTPIHFLALQRKQSRMDQRKKEENQIETLTLRVRCLPHHRRTGSALLTDVRLHEEGAGPPDDAPQGRRRGHHCSKGRCHGRSSPQPSAGRTLRSHHPLLMDLSAGARTRWRRSSLVRVRKDAALRLLDGGASIQRWARTPARGSRRCRLRLLIGHRCPRDSAAQRRNKGKVESGS
jgi:hypothetical protein